MRFNFGCARVAHLGYYLLFPFRHSCDISRLTDLTKGRYCSSLTCAGLTHTARKLIIYGLSLLSHTPGKCMIILDSPANLCLTTENYVKKLGKYSEWKLSSTGLSWRPIGFQLVNYLSWAMYYFSSNKWVFTLSSRLAILISRNESITVTVSI